MSKIQNENHVSIFGWMINELNLKGNDLMVYAIIYGFSQAPNTYFTGSLSYLASWCNSSIRGIQKNLKSLIDKKLIIKNEYYEDNVKLCSYKALTGIEQSSIGYGTKFVGGMELSSNNNIDNRLIDYNNIYYKELEKIFEEKEIYIHELMGDNQKEKFLFFQKVITEIYKSKVYKSYIKFITFEDIKNSYEKLQEQKEKRKIKSDLQYMKRVLLQEAKKKIA